MFSRIQGPCFWSSIGAQKLRLADELLVVCDEVLERGGFVAVALGHAVVLGHRLGR